MAAIPVPMFCCVPKIAWTAVITVE